MGGLPYGGLSNYEVKLLVERNERLEAPTTCPHNMYLLMKACWNQNPKERPDFMEIFELLADVRRVGFAPSDDYYSGEGDSPLAHDIYDSDNFVDCTPILRETRIKWLMRAGVTVTDDNVEELLDSFEVGGSNSVVVAKPEPSLKGNEYVELKNRELRAVEHDKLCGKCSKRNNVVEIMQEEICTISFE